MIFFEAIGWICMVILWTVGVLVGVFLLVGVAMSFYSVFLMILAYIKGGKKGLRRHNELMKYKYSQYSIHSC